MLKLDKGKVTQNVFVSRIWLLLIRSPAPKFGAGRREINAKNHFTVGARARLTLDSALPTVLSTANVLLTAEK